MEIYYFGDSLVVISHYRCGATVAYHWQKRLFVQILAGEVKF